MSEKVGVIGLGSFGTTVATLLSNNADVLVYSRRQAQTDQINQTHQHLGVTLSERIEVTSDLARIGNECNLIFPVIPSRNFREMICALNPYINPSHVLIHGTKGFDLAGYSVEDLDSVEIARKHVSTMSELIQQETNVVRIGCLSGPNLAREILDGQPAATVLASDFDEVIVAGRKVLSSKNFSVFGSHDLKGAELAGAYKNIIALASGILGGLNMGKNIQSLLITKGLGEMIRFGTQLGTTSKAFLGIAGIGDLIATATSENSRNYKCGMRIAQGETLAHIQETSEVIEGVRTLKIVHQLAKNIGMHIPITQMIYKIIFDEYDIRDAITYLMRYPYAQDVDFI